MCNENVELSLFESLYNISNCIIISIVKFFSSKHNKSLLVPTSLRTKKYDMHLNKINHSYNHN